MEFAAKVKITNRVYQKEYDDTNSTPFKDLEKEFKEEMGQIYKNVDGYRDVKIVSVINGSIDVNFTIIMEINMPNNVSAIDREVGNRTKEFVKQLEHASARDCTQQPQEIFRQKHSRNQRHTSSATTATTSSGHHGHTPASSATTSSATTAHHSRNQRHHVRHHVVGHNGQHSRKQRHHIVGHHSQHSRNHHHHLTDHDYHHSHNHNHHLTGHYYHHSHNHNHHLTEKPSFSLASFYEVSETCENGGTHDGIKCLCLSNFYGPKCEFPVEDIPLEVESVPVTVEVQVKITNREFEPELENQDSEAYKNLEEEFKTQMDHVYKDVSGYESVVILRLRKGSIIVDHEVIFKAVINNNVNIIDKTVQDLTEAVQKQLTTINTTQEECKTGNSSFCFSAPPDPILGASANFSAEAACRKDIDPRYADYYYPDNSTGTLRCISDCTRSTKNTMNCNNGMCRISERGPYCKCNDVESFWYMDDRCQSRIQKSDVGFGVGLAVLIVISTVLAIFLFRARQRKSHSSFSDDAEAWYEDDEEEWRPPGGLSIVNEGAAYEECQDRSKSFQVSLDSVDTTAQMQFQKPTALTNC
ncbi:mucin-3B-like [Lacerta agilis]|uniref:mucin-3B-like n=1 Tax=Lacerta agilis TaxID=80427 RepID=UPI00141A2431|nr:mucin-3B-like [Lacerta agilis]